MTETAKPDWPQIRAEYEAGEVSLTELCAAHAITANQLSHRRRVEGWPLRQPRSGRQRRIGLLDRMLGLIEVQITQLERKLKEDAMSASEMRMLESMTKALDKISALKAAETKVTKKRVRADPELEAIRERLVERISRLETEE